MFTAYEMLEFERRGRILTVTLRRPPLNAGNAKMHEELSRVFTDIAADAESDVVVLTGAGKAFSAGGDINEMRVKADQPALWMADMRETRQTIMGLLQLDKPVIARIPGPAIGAGATLALLCDIIFAVEDAVIGDPHVRVGLAAGDGAAFSWPRNIGFPRAKEFLLTGDSLSGRRAAEIGLINYAVPEAELDARVYALAERLAAGSQSAIRATKRVLNSLLLQNASVVLDAHLGIETLTYMHPDHRAGVQSFLDRKK